MPDWLTTPLAEAKTYGPIVLIPAGAVVALVVLVLIWRSLRKQKPDRIAVNVAVLLASAFSAQGMYEVATTKLHLPWYLAAGLFAVAEMAMLASAVRAHRHYEATSTTDEPGQLGPHARFVWLIAFAAGVIVSLNAHSPSEYFLRLFMPLLVAGLWRMGYVSPIAKKRAADAITMRWTWRRIGEKWGIVEPGERSLAAISADRQRRQMIAHAHAYHRGSMLLGWWHGSRLRKLALDADEPLIELVQASVDRVHRIEALTAPAPTGTALAGRWWMHPWRTARKIATELVRLSSALETNRTEAAALSVQVAERISDLNRELNSAREQIAERELAERNLRTQFAADLSAAELASRTEAEQKIRAELEPTIAALRTEVEELSARRTEPAGPRRTELPAHRAKPQSVGTLVHDAEIAERLQNWFGEQTELTGKQPTRYRVELTAPCSSRQADRVLILLANRYAELKSGPNGSANRSGREPNRTGEPAADDLDHELVELTG